MISNNTNSTNLHSLHPLFSNTLWASAILVVLFCTIAALTTSSMLNKKIDQKDQQYGQALANVAARRAIQSTLNLDLVSLQVILQEIVENPSVTNATIHDVENNLLVQATSSAQKNRRQTISRQTNFTAPINVHDSITGYVTVSIDFSSANSHKTLYGIFSILAIGLIAINLVLQKFLVSGQLSSRNSESSTKPSINTLPIVTQLPQTEEESLPEETPTHIELDKKNPRIELIIQFQNLRTLYGQLNHRSFRSIIQRIEIQLRDLMALYSGELTLINADNARITFRNNTLTEAAFNAICSAHLVTTLNKQQEGIHLALSCLIVKRDPDTSTLKHLAFNLFKQDTESDILNESDDSDILIENELLADTHSPCLATRVEFSLEDTPSSSTAIIQQIKEPYSSLLEKQLAQLQNY
ncbi:MAG: hypothetical protein ACRBCS_06435 [Cellvibrionaceae bacterium]